MSEDTNTSIVVIDTKPLSMLHRKILEADLLGKYNTVSELARAVGCDRQTVMKAQQLSTYIDSYNESQSLIINKSINIKKHSINELKVAMHKLSTLVQKDPDLQTYAAYVKLLIDVVKGTAEVDLDMEDESIDTDSIRNDLESLINVAMKGQVSPAQLVDEYILTGIVPKVQCLYQEPIEKDTE